MARRRFRRRAKSRRWRRVILRRLRFKRGSMRKRYTRKIRPISGRQKAKGWKTRINNRPETKSVPYLGQKVDIPNFVNMNGNPNLGVIWKLNGTDTAGNRFYPSPTQGTGNTNVEGLKYNLRYCELTFLLNPYNLVPADFTGHLRIILIKERQANKPFVNAVSFLANAIFMSPVNTKEWDLQMDKVIPFTTGLTSNNVTGTSNFTSIMPKPMKFRILIPLRHSFTVTNANNQFPLNMYLIMFTDIVDRYWTNAASTSCVYYFRDP